MARSFSQVKGVNYIETMSLTPAAAPVKMITTIASEKGLLVCHTDVPHAIVLAPLKEEILKGLLSGCGPLSGKVVRLLKFQYGLKYFSRKRNISLVNWLVEGIGPKQ